MCAIQRGHLFACAPAEAAVVLHVVETLAHRAAAAAGGGAPAAVITVGIIAFYTAQEEMLQAELLRRRIAGATVEGMSGGAAHGGHTYLHVEVSSVDGFQGQEKDVIVLSFTRSNNAGAVGFLASAQRLNVALTRARKQLVAVGNAPFLRTAPKLRAADPSVHYGEAIVGQAAEVPGGALLGAADWCPAQAWAALGALERWVKEAATVAAGGVAQAAVAGGVRKPLLTLPVAVRAGGPALVRTRLLHCILLLHWQFSSPLSLIAPCLVAVELPSCWHTWRLLSYLSAQRPADHSTKICLSS